MQTVPEDELSALINNIMSDYSPEIATNNFDYRVTAISRRRYTIGYKLESLNSTIPYLFAKSKDNHPNDDDTETEFRTLKYLWEKGFDREEFYQVPKALDYIKEHNLLTMEFFGGDKLSAVLVKNLSFPLSLIKKNSLNEKVIEVSNWLCRYEDLVYSGENTAFSSFINPYIERKVDEVYFWTDEQKQAVKKKIVQRLTSEDIPVQLNNTDFKTHNILITPKQTMVIDWEKIQRKGPVFWMAAAFLRSLDSLKANPLITKKSVENLKDIFIDNYLGKCRFAKHAHFLDLIRSLETITALAESPSSIKRKSPNRIEKNALKSLNSLLD